LVVPLEDINPEEIEYHGGKSSNLARLHNMGFRVPRGFSVTSGCFQRILDDVPKIQEIIAKLGESDDYEEMLESSIALQSLIGEYSVPSDIKQQIATSFQNLQKITGNLSHGYAVRSSATLEDRSDISFAGQADSYLCITGIESIIESVKGVWQSAFSPRAVIYLHTKGVSLEKMKMAVFIQEMVPSDISGVMFTANVVTRNTDEILINSTWGIGDTLVSGKVIPDTYVLTKIPLAVSQRERGAKSKMCVPKIMDDCVQTTLIDTPSEKSTKLSLDDDTLLWIAETGLKIENGYGSPQDIEWCLTGDELVILQSRPITTL
jgi:pyruvate,water dikinase